MRTEALIAALAADDHGSGTSTGRIMAVALLAGSAISALGFLVWIGPRPDLYEAHETIRFYFKFALTIALAVTGVTLAFWLACPGTDTRRLLWLFAVPLGFLTLGIASELVSAPSSDWQILFAGSNARRCITYIPLLSLPPLAALLLALRQGAVCRPILCGSVAGAAAAGVAAALYALSCTDDSPLFVAVWYTLATSAVAIVGGFTGRFVLRW